MRQVVARIPERAVHHHEQALRIAQEIDNRYLEAESLIIIRRGSRGGAQVTAPRMAVAASSEDEPRKRGHLKLVD